VNYTDKQLKTALEMMLPDLIFNCGDLYIYDTEFGAGSHRLVSDTELLHICWLVEETLNEIESADYAEFLRPITANYKLLYHASWHQRVEALAKVKGIEI